MRTRYILGTKVQFDLNMEDVVELISEYIDKGQVGIVCTTNPEFVVEAREDSEFRQIINESLISVPDGIGILMADRYLEIQTKLKRDLLFPFKSFFVGLYAGLDVFVNYTRYAPVHGVDLMKALLLKANSKGYKVFLYGGWPKDNLGRMKKVDYDLAQKLAHKLANEYPDLIIVGGTSQYSPKPYDDTNAVKAVRENMKKSNNSNIDILFASFKHGVQEKWLMRNLNKLDATVGIGVGGSFEFLSGDVKRAPSPVRKYHLEWLYRLVTQPYRIKRIITAFLIFPLLVFRESISQ